MCDLKEKSSPLHSAVYNENVEEVQVLLKCSVDDINTTHFYTGETPLHTAVRLQSVEIVKVLLEFRPDLLKTNFYNQTAVQCALRLKNYELAMILIDALRDVNAADNDGFTVLHEAAHLGDVLVINELLSRGADVNANSKYNETPLHSVAIGNCEQSNITAAEVLLKNGADVDAKTRFGATPISILASNSSNAAIIELFLKYKADVDSKDTSGHTPLSKALFDSNFDKRKIQLLLKVSTQGCSVSLFRLVQSSKFHRTELAVAQKRLKFLLANLDVNTIDKNGKHILSYDLPDYSWRTVVEHLAKLQVNKVRLDSKIVEIISSKSQYQSYFTQCEEELLLAKGTKLENSWVTYFHLLMDDKKKIANLAGNERLVKDFESSDCVGKFPIFGQLMQKRVSKAISKRKILDQTMETLRKCLPIENLSNVIIRKIVEYSLVEKKRSNKI